MPQMKEEGVFLVKVLPPFFDKKGISLLKEKRLNYIITLIS